MPSNRPWMAFGLVALALLAPAASGQGVVSTPPVDSAAREAAGASQDEAWDSLELSAPSDGSKLLKRGKSSGGSAATTKKTAGGWYRTTGALAAVVGLIALLAWGYRTVSAGGGRLALTSRNRMPGLIEVISRTSLSPRQTLCLVRVGPRLVLVGVSQDSMQALDVIEDGSAASRLSGEAARRKSDSVSAEFDSWLQEESGAYERPDEQTFETSTRMGDVKRQLAGTIRRIKAAVGRS